MACEKESTLDHIVPSAEIDKFVDSFYQDASEYGITRQFYGLIGIDNRGLPANAAGICRRTDAEGISIRIDSSSWARADSFRKKAIVYHELGHCELLLYHNCLVSQRTCRSLMTAAVSRDVECVPCRHDYGSRPLWNAYLEELFTGVVPELSPAFLPTGLCDSTSFSNETIVNALDNLSEQNYPIQFSMKFQCESDQTSIARFKIRDIIFQYSSELITLSRHNEAALNSTIFEHRNADLTSSMTITILIDEAGLHVFEGVEWLHTTTTYGDSNAIEDVYFDQCLIVDGVVLNHC